MLSKQDKLLMVLPRLVKKAIGKIMLYQGGEREKYTHLRKADMCKWQRVIPRHKGSPRYRIANGWKMSMDLLILKP
jgi:hypothetical protein